jgi:hypothetical protein
VDDNYAAGGGKAPGSNLGDARPARPEWGNSDYVASAAAVDSDLEKRLKRYLKRLSVFAGIPAFIVASGLFGAKEPDGTPTSYQGQAVIYGLLAASILGLTWYLLDWTRIPWPVRYVTALMLLAIAASIAWMAIGCLQGYAPS